jgi:hypothetical protein
MPSSINRTGIDGVEVIDVDAYIRCHGLVDWSAAKSVRLYDRTATIEMLTPTKYRSPIQAPSRYACLEVNDQSLLQSMLSGHH